MKKIISTNNAPQAIGPYSQAVERNNLIFCSGQSLTDLANFQIVNEIYGSYFKENPPVRATIEVKSLPKGAQIEIEMVCFG